MANENETNEIEMNDLLGHKEDIMSSVEKGAQHKKARGHVAIPGEKPLTSPKKANRCQILSVFVLLLGIIFFAIDLLYMSHEGTTDMSEQNKKQSPNANDTKGQSPRDFVPKTKAAKDEDKEGQAKKESSSVVDPIVINIDQDIQNDNTNSDNQMTIVDGIDDKDVYCEDLSQYQEWHNTKITLNDGIMYEVVKQMDHDKSAFTYVTAYPLEFGQIPGHCYLIFTGNIDNSHLLLNFLFGVGSILLLLL